MCMCKIIKYGSVEFLKSLCIKFSTKMKIEMTINTD